MITILTDSVIWLAGRLYHRLGDQNCDDEFDNGDNGDNGDTIRMVIARAVTIKMRAQMHNA